MVRHEVVSLGIIHTTIRFFLRTDPDTPYFDVFWDLDTESVAYFEPTKSLIGEAVLHCFSTWTRDSLRTALIAHLATKGCPAEADVVELVEGILECLRGREAR